MMDIVFNVSTFHKTMRPFGHQRSPNIATMSKRVTVRSYA